MKQTLSLCLTVLLLFSLCACGTEERPGSGGPLSTGSAASSSVPTESAVPAPAATERASIVRVQGGQVWAVGTDEDSPLDFFTFSLPEGSIVPTPCTVVDVGYNGDIAESYPAEITAESVAMEQEKDDFISLYFQVLQDIHLDDPALSETARYFAFDFSGVHNLTSRECRAMGWLFATDHQREPLFGTFDELAREGYIDEENLYFPDGVLFQLEDSLASSGSFSFDVEKWVSGLGAVGYDDCRAKKENGSWTYESGAAWIS